MRKSGDLTIPQTVTVGMASPTGLVKGWRPSSLDMQPEIETACSRANESLGWTERADHVYPVSKKRRGDKMQIQISERRALWWLVVLGAVVLTWNILTAMVGWPPRFS
jgi:hypothetical protein